MSRVYTRTQKRRNARKRNDAIAKYTIATFTALGVIACGYVLLVGLMSFGGTF